MSKKNIAVFLHGFDIRSVYEMENYFAKQSKEEYRCVRQEDQADISIIDIDSGCNEAFIANQRVSFPKQPFVIIGTRSFKNSDPLIFVFKKPLIFQQLDELMQQISLIVPKLNFSSNELNQGLQKYFKSKLISKRTNNRSIIDPHITNPDLSIKDKNQLACFVGRQKNIDSSNPQEIMKILFDPSKTILTSIKKVIERSKCENKMLEFTGLDKRFIIDPQSNTIFTFISESVLRPLCLLSIRETVSIKTIKEGRGGKAFKSIIQKNKLDVKEWDIDCFIWKMALWTSRGKIPRHIDINKPVYLSEWPNLTRLQEIPHSYKIAAVMILQTKTLPDIASVLGIEQRFVFAFFNAAYSLGVTDNCKRQSDMLFKNESNILENPSCFLIQDALEKLELKSIEIISKRVGNE